MTSKILLYNPNTTASMTARMAPVANMIAQNISAKNIEIIGQTATKGPVSIEGFYDEAFSVPPLLERFQTVESEGFDACIIGCFDDTGLDAARCLLNIPVVGLCESACIVAGQVSNSFAIVTTLRRSVPALEKIVSHYGYGNKCKAVFASEIPVLDLDENPEVALKALVEAGEYARDLLGVEAIILGCAGMVDLAQKVERALKMPVIEPVSAAAAQATALVALSATNSKANGYQTPRAKEFK